MDKMDWICIGNEITFSLPDSFLFKVLVELKCATGNDEIVGLTLPVEDNNVYPSQLTFITSN